MGRVTPIKFTQYDQFAPVGGSFSEDGDAQVQMEVRSPVPTPQPGVPRGVRVKGLYPFQGQSPEELSFQPGDVLNVINQNGDWWMAEMHGRQGLIPANYVQII